MDIKTITMDLRADIKWIQEELNDVKDPSLIEAFKQLLHYRKKVVQTDWWYDLSEQEQKDIEIGIAQANKGEYVEDQEVMNRFKKWH